MNQHAKNERELARLVAQETVEDLFGGRVRTFNGPGFLVGLSFVLFILVLMGLLVLVILDTASAAAPTTLFLPVVAGAERQFVLDCMNGAGQLIPCPTVVP